MADRFDRFTDLLREVLLLAAQEAVRAGRRFVDTEQLLLALLCGGPSPALATLKGLGVDTPGMEAALRRMFPPVVRNLSGLGGMTDDARRVIEATVRAASAFEHRYIGTEYLLLGLMADGEITAARVLTAHGVVEEHAYAEVARVLARGIRDWLPDPGATSLAALQAQLARTGRDRDSAAEASLSGTMIRLTAEIDHLQGLIDQLNEHGSTS